MDAPDRSHRLTAMHRRTFLKTAGAVSATAGLEGILAVRRAPAFAQATKIHLLQWVDFIPEGDVEVKRQVAEYNKQMKVEVTFETINANDLQAHITAAIQSAAGPDIIMMLHNWPHLYAGGLADVGDLAEWKAADQGDTTRTPPPPRESATAGWGCRISRGRPDCLPQVVVR
jgi:ABC-type glycerol-3-phosphate transport system substrate-binding protein